MRKLWVVIFLAAFCSSCSSALAENPQSTDWMALVFGCTSNTCVIKGNGGGLIWRFEQAVQQAREKKISVRIDGPCYSSCVLFASRIRRYVCVTRNARMGIHMGRRFQLFDPSGQKLDPALESNAAAFANPPPGYRIEELDYFEMNYGKDINAWAKLNDKMPATSEVYVLTVSEALRFWRPCL